MGLECSYCLIEGNASGGPNKVVRFGRFLRKSDQSLIQRYRCTYCKKSFSQASTDLFFNQRKREYNSRIALLLVSGVSQRRAALILGINRKTLVKKFILLGFLAQYFLLDSNLGEPKADTIEFDDLETIEHTKLKPLSVTLAVEYQSRRILGFKVSQMPAKGHLTKLSFKKYGLRKDLRRKGRRDLFTLITPFVSERSLIKSDENPHYTKDVKEFFPESLHQVHKGRRGCVAGQGELKKIGFDPLFSLNHTCAMLRANINRLFRKTWCTTKKPERLSLHLALYALFHNARLKAL